MKVELKETITKMGCTGIILNHPIVSLDGILSRSLQLGALSLAVIALASVSALEKREQIQFHL